jgi:diguanylate cyclase (GGDEF)-like protein
MSQSAFRTQLADRRRRQISDAVGELRLLPTTVGVPMRILQLQRDPNSKLTDYGAALAADPSLVSKVLGLANSAACAPGRTITKVSEAIALIGLKNLLSLVFGLSIGGIFNKMGVAAAEAKGLWRASLLKAVAAREFALKTDRTVAEEAYVCGLLQDISLPVLSATDPSAWPETVAILDLEQKARGPREEAMYGTDHGAIGRQIAQRIGLPELFQNATALHHADGTALAVLGNPALARAVQFAAVLPHRLAAYAPSVAQKLAAKLAALDADKALDQPALLKSVGDGYAATLALLGESDESSAAVKEFLQALGAEVAGILEGAIGESLAQIAHLKTRSAELEGKIAGLKREALQADYDELTRALTRRGFLARAERFLSLAREYETPCAVGFVDVDNFKAINNRLGHAGGDAALVAVAEKLCEHYRGRGIVGRVGGDEFAFLMIAKTRDEVVAESDRLTAVLEGMTVKHPAEAAAGPATGHPTSLPLTTSIGMLWLGVPTAGQTPEVTLTSADGVMRDARRKRAELAAFVQAG